MAYEPMVGDLVSVRRTPLPPVLGWLLKIHQGAAYHRPYQVQLYQTKAYIWALRTELTLVVLSFAGPCRLGEEP